MKDHHKKARRLIQTAESVRNEVDKLGRLTDEPKVAKHCTAATKSLDTSLKHLRALLEIH